MYALRNPNNRNRSFRTFRGALLANVARNAWVADGATGTPYDELRAPHTFDVYIRARHALLTRDKFEWCCESMRAITMRRTSTVRGHKVRASPRPLGPCVRDHIALDAVRTARAECDDSVARMKRKMQHNGVDEPCGLDAVCDKICEIEELVATGLADVMSKRDSSADDDPVLGSTLGPRDAGLSRHRDR